EQEHDWSGATLWLVDERFVPADDTRANRARVDETILRRVERRPAWHPVATDAASPEEAAALYDTELRRLGVPQIVFLGLGSDGHTASLFPGLPALGEHERLAVATDAGLEPFVPRITLTLPAIARADQVVFLVTGDGKADRVAAAFAGEPTPAVPGSLARSAHGTTTVVLDRAAAARL
ncbi:MAG: 6-phosphogluconolactonase, partial [Gaiella sp.]